MWVKLNTLLRWTSLVQEAHCATAESRLVGVDSLDYAETACGASNSNGNVIIITINNDIIIVIVIIIIIIIIIIISDSTTASSSSCSPSAVVDAVYLSVKVENAEHPNVDHRNVN
mgnify:CR=1 FL=1